jgi:hypothetical protein
MIWIPSEDDYERAVILLEDIRLLMQPPIFPGPPITEPPITEPPIGQVVANLNDAGPGSLREALLTGGLIRFDVGGVITLNSKMSIKKANTIIAGETAPSPGITLTRAPLEIRKSDVTVRHIRVRIGDDDPGAHQANNRDGIAITPLNDGVILRNVLIQNCSVSWAIDGLIDVYTPNFARGYAGVTNCVVHNCILSEALHDSIHPLGKHSTGLLIGHDSKGSEYPPGGGTTRIGVVRCIFAHNNNRNPIIGADGNSAWCENNFIYNPSDEGLQFRSGGTEASFCTAIGNLQVAGDDSSTTTFYHTNLGENGSECYVEDNQGYNNPPAADPGVSGDDWIFEYLSPGYDPRQAEPPEETTLNWGFMGGKPTQIPKEDVEATLSAEAGARPWDRDAIDTRIINEIATRTGDMINSQDEKEGLPA